MRKSTVSIMLIVALLQGCSNKDKITITDLPDHAPDAAATHQIKEETLDVKDDKKSEEKQQAELPNQQPTHNGEKFKLDDDSFNLEGVDKVMHQQDKPIMVAVMAPMSGKNDMIGNAIMDGAHMSLIELFEKHKIPVRLNVIDTGSGVEDIEFNITKLDEQQYDMILGLTSEDQEKFVTAYLENQKPLLVTLNPRSHSGNQSCAISPSDQLKVALENAKSDEEVYVVLPISEDAKPWTKENVKILQYGVKDVKQTNDDLQKIALKLKENGKKSLVIFTDPNWKLQKFITNLEAFQIKDITRVVLASLSNLNGRMQTAAEKRHKFGNIAVITESESEYKGFMSNFHKEHQRKPLDLSFWAYKAIQGLKNANLDHVENKWHLEGSVCKNQLSFIDQK
jgi:hypothetical protein